MVQVYSYNCTVGQSQQSIVFRTPDRLHYPGRAIPEGPGNGHGHHTQYGQCMVKYGQVRSSLGQDGSDDCPRSHWAVGAVHLPRDVPLPVALCTRTILPQVDILSILNILDLVSHML
jgi:hypothetical protein